MDLSILVIVFVVVTVIYDLFIPKYNEEAIERIKSRNNSYVIGDLIVAVIIFLGISIIFSMVVKNYLLDAQCFALCETSVGNCLCVVNNSLIAFLTFLVQLVGIVNLYQTFAYSYSYFAMTRETIIKVVMAVLVFLTVIAGEIIVSSNVTLNNISFPDSEKWLNFIIKVIVYSPAIVYSLVVLIAIVKSLLFGRRDEDDEYMPAKPIKVVKEKKINYDEIENIDEDEEDYNDYYGTNNDDDDLTSNYYY